MGVMEMKSRSPMHLTLRPRFSVAIAALCRGGLFHATTTTGNARLQARP